MHAVDLMFLPLVMLDAGWRIVGARQPRHLVILIVLAGLWAMELGYHLQPTGPFAHGALILAMTLMLVIGGRITPSFTRNWLAKAGLSPLPRPFGRFDKVTIGLTVAAVALWVGFPEGLATGVVLALAGALHLVRVARWRAVRGGPQQRGLDRRRRGACAGRAQPDALDREGRMSLTPDEARLIGASDLPALLALSPWSGPVALWARMVHGWQGEQTADMSAGHAAEDYNRALYRQATGYQLSGPAKWRHPLHPWLRCSPDDTATDTPEGRRGVELKRYNWLEGWGAVGTDAVPVDIWVQVQFQGGVALDLDEWDTGNVDVSGLLRGEHRLYHVPHVAEVYERCKAVAERFWLDFVRPARFPEGERLPSLQYQMVRRVRDALAIAEVVEIRQVDHRPMLR